MSGKVKCADCGYLAVMHRTTGEYISASASFRSAGQTTSAGGGGSHFIHDPMPFCAEKVVNYKDLLKGLRNEENDGTNRAAEMNRERECGAFIEWNPCFSPKEHKQMKLEAELRKWQANREDADRAWRAEQAASQEAWQERQASDDKKWREGQAADERTWRTEEAHRSDDRHKQSLWVSVAAALVAAMIGAVATLAAVAWQDRQPARVETELKPPTATTPEPASPATSPTPPPTNPRRAN